MPPRLSAIDAASTALCPDPAWCSRWFPIPAGLAQPGPQMSRQTGVALTLLLPAVPASAPSGVDIHTQYAPLGRQDGLRWHDLT
ncbi:hypothetical protein LX32DRAFT_728529 [Colletotrichum zoysiae]|uniref:Uncharacterized protein n=1 Tax=Colletotrichum zoysiae TaxID=1216348 RepID=A0AAD9M511_9PEZI|nr:hypothetical protein LX32DRAFT_728529 [Colletotrichum zoysiae]